MLSRDSRRNQAIGEYTTCGWAGTLLNHLLRWLFLSS